MPSQPVADDKAVEGPDRCWCCGSQYPLERMVTLGMHPEVSLCFGCAPFVNRRAMGQADRLNPAPATRVRDAVRGARTSIIEHGWHERRVIGPILRGLDRHLP